MNYNKILKGLAVLLVACPSLAANVDVRAKNLTCETSIFGGVSQCEEELELVGNTLGVKKVVADCVTTWVIGYEDGTSSKSRSFQNTIKLPSNTSGQLNRFFIRQNVESVSKAKKPKSTTTCQVSAKSKNEAHY